MSSLRKAFIITKTQCRIRIKETGKHKIVKILPLRKRAETKIDEDGDEYEIENQDYIVIDNNQVLGYLINPLKNMASDVQNEYPYL